VSSLDHEIAHHEFDRGAIDTVRWERLAEKERKGLFLPEGRPTNIMWESDRSSAVKEYHAETTEAYYHDREYVQKKMPETYAYLEEQHG